MTDKLKKDGQWRHLTIRSLDPMDAGFLACETLHDKTSTLFSVKEPVVTIVTPLEDASCIEGGTVSYQLQLSHTLRPQVPITWMRNAKPLVHDGSKYQISALPNGHYSITMRKVQRDEAGRVCGSGISLGSCVASMPLRAVADGR